MLLDIEGLKQIDELIREESLKLKQIQKTKAEAFQNDTNSWHDNSSYDMAMERENQVYDEMNRLSKIKTEARIVAPHNIKGKIDIGDKVLISMDDDSFMVILTGKFLANKDRDEITLNSPLGNAIYKKSVSDEIKYKVGNILYKAKIAQICSR